MFVGIDPSQRHTGLCVLHPDGRIAATKEIVTGDLSLMDSGVKVRRELHEFIIQEDLRGSVFCMEKQLPRLTAGPQLFYVQMLVLEILQLYTERLLVFPLPVQLKSYIKNRTGETPRSKSDVVRLAKALSGVKGRTSSHVADAYFLALLSMDLRDGKHSFRLSEAELPLISWGTICDQSSYRSATEAREKV